MIAGWDIGGAHLKCAALDAAGRRVGVWEVPAAPRVRGILAGADQLQKDPARGLLFAVRKFIVDRLSRVGERPFQAAHGVVRVVTRRQRRSVIWGSA